jgi:long-chain acyl-CoA synthetase
MPQEGIVSHKTWSELADDVLRMTAYLNKWGVRPGDRVALWGENGYEWILIDLAIQALQAIHVPLHGSLTATAAAAQIAHAECQFVMTATAAMADALAGEPEAKFLGAKSVRRIGGDGGEPTLLEQIAQWSPEAGMTAYMNHADRFDPQAVATILYSSGTTGEPKGVALTHANLISNSQAVVEVLEETPSVRRLALLPFSHIYARTCDLYAWLVGGSQLALARSRDTVCADSQVIQPTLINAVPSFYQRIAQRVAESESTSRPLTIQQLLGGNLWACICGGAHLPVDLFDFFHARGVTLLPGYGLTESSPVIAVGTPAALRRGAVGKAIPGIEVRIADDGELLTRGPHVMKEYWKDDELTRHTIRDGWLYTGDLGAIDADGFISVTGRKKELIVLSTGKKAVPGHIEGVLLREPLVYQAMVLGNDQPYLAALIVPNHKLLKDWATSQGLIGLDGDDVIRHPRIGRLYAERIADLMVSLPPYERVKRFALLERPFTIEAGHLTLKQSLRRDAVHRDHSREIDALFSRGGTKINYHSGRSAKILGEQACGSD